MTHGSIRELTQGADQCVDDRQVRKKQNRVTRSAPESLLAVQQEAESQSV